MRRKLAVPLCIVATILSTSLFAGPREDLLAQYATAAKTETPTFSGFSAARGKTLHTHKFAGGKPDTPACTACHGENPRGAGKFMGVQGHRSRGGIGHAEALYRPGQGRKVVQAQLQGSARARMHGTGKRRLAQLHAQPVSDQHTHHFTRSTP